MDSLAEEKRKFAEYLIMLGALLAVFLGLVIDRASVLFFYTVILVVAFMVSALFCYAVVTFGSMLTLKWSWLKSPDSVYGLLGATFAGLVSLGAARALLVVFPTSSNGLVVIGVIVTFLIVFVGVYSFIQAVFDLREPETGQPTATA